MPPDFSLGALLIRCGRELVSRLYKRAPILRTSLQDHIPLSYILTNDHDLVTNASSKSFERRLMAGLHVPKLGPGKTFRVFAEQKREQDKDQLVRHRQRGEERVVRCLHHTKGWMAAFAEAPGTE